MLITEDPNQKFAKSPYPKIVLTSLFLFLCLCLCLSLLLSPSPSLLLHQYELEDQQFQLYLQSFHKSYSTASEYSTRFSIFRDNYSYIKLSNQLSRSYTLGLNAFSDLTPQEFQLLTSSPIPSPSLSPSLLSEPAPLDLPNAVDWRTQNAVTTVKNQDSCSGGWAFSATGAVEGAWVLGGHSLLSLSEQQLLDCSTANGNKGCSSGTPANAFAYITANGIASETTYPYEAKENRCNKTLAAKIAAKTVGSKAVTANSAVALRTAVAIQPVAVAVDANAAVWQSYSQGTISGTCGTSINHYVLVVGYNMAADIPYYVAKNSWGVIWGMAGYVQIAIVDGAGVCGIQTNPVYPQV